MEVMKYLKLFENFNDIHGVCIEYGIRNYTIRSDGSVDVDGDVWMRNIGFEELPIGFGKVIGEFNCAGNILTSLKGCPQEIGGNFNFYDNQLTSLEWCPKEVGGYFDCAENKLTSLEGCPKEIGGYFDCSENKLTSLEWCPKEVGGYFNCSYNKLTIIDYLPERIEGDIYFYNNQIRDIKVEDKNYLFLDKCYLDGNPINCMFKYWEGDLKNFIIELEFEDFIRDEGKSVDMLRFEYALNGKEYNGDITNYKLIYNK